VVEEIEKKDPVYYGKEIPEHIKERYNNSFSSFGLSKEKRGEKQAEIVEDGLYLKTLLEKVPSERLGEMKQLSIMETIFNENVKIREKAIENKVFIEVEEIEGPKQTIFDPGIEYKTGDKGKKSWVGSKCHVVETAEKGRINFLTDMIYQSQMRMIRDSQKGRRMQRTQRVTARETVCRRQIHHGCRTACIPEKRPGAHGVYAKRLLEETRSVQIGEVSGGRRE